LASDIIRPQSDPRQMIPMTAWSGLVDGEDMRRPGIADIRPAATHGLVHRDTIGVP
jgi:hypothetical protein